MLNELLKDEEFGKIFFAELLNQNGCDTGVDTASMFEEWARKNDTNNVLEGVELERFKQNLVKKMHSSPNEDLVVLGDVIDKEDEEDDTMEDIPINIRQLEEKHREDEPEESLDELEERELTKEELDKIVEKVNSDLSDPEKATEIVKEVFETLLDEYSEHPKGDEPEIQLAEPDYYAGNGLSPLEAFKKGLLSREETIGFIKGNIIKYVTRAGHKHNASEDMVKAIDYCGHLKRLYEHEMQNKPHLEADLVPIDFNDDTAKQAKETVINAFESLDKIQDVETKP